MSFDPHTIEHLGVKMYSNIPNAIAELIANAYNAEAENVHIKLVDNGKDKSICIIDDGVGMDFDEINSKFLRIGRKRRVEDGNALSPNGKRKVTGKKGLGKLAFFGIGDTIDIEEGQKLLSMGIMTGARNPVAHEEIAELRDSGLFSEKDCLDALSLLSHLFRRLDDA